MLNWPYLIIAYFSLIVYGFTDNVRGPLFESILKEFQVNDTLGSLFFSLSSVSGILLTFVAFKLMQSYNRWTILTFSAFVLFITLNLMALTSHFYFFLSLSMLYGISAGMLSLLPNIFVNLSSPQHLKQQTMSGLHAMYGLASLVAPLVVNLFFSWNFDFRKSFMLVSLLPLSLFLFGLYRFSKRLDIQKSYPLQNNQTSLQSLFSDIRPIWAALILSFYVSAEVLISSRLSLHLSRTHHFTPEQGARYLTSFFMTLLLSRIFFAFYKPPFSLKNQLATSGVLSVFIFLMALYIHPLFFILLGISMGPFYPHTISFIEKEFTTEINKAISLVAGMSSLSLACMHFIVGFLTDHFSVSAALLMGPIFMILALIMLLTFNERRLV